MLGFKIVSHILRPKDAKFEALAKYEMPKTVHKVQGLYGLLLCFCQFVLNFVSLSALISRLMRDYKGEVKWT